MDPHDYGYDDDIDCDLEMIYDASLDDNVDYEVDALRFDDEDDDTFVDEINHDVEEVEAASVEAEVESNFSKLKAMFPNIDDNYIQKVCDDPPVSGSEGDTFVLLINHLLTYEEKVDESLLLDNEEVIDKLSKKDRELSQKLVMEELNVAQKQLHEEEWNEQLVIKLLKQEKQEKLEEEARNEQLLHNLLDEEQRNVKDKMEILESILPDVNPEELKNIVKIKGNDPEFLEEFVESKLLNRNYEKRPEYFARLKNSMMIEQYTSKFDVVTFVTQFPEPIQHFENPNRQCFFQESAFNYLKQIFKNFNDQYLNEKYSYFNYNLSLTVNYMRSIQIEPSMEIDHEIKDIPLLQEIAFIKNKIKIQEYLEAVQLKEEQELKDLKAKKLLLECQCCYDEVKPYESIECKNGHLFCKNCIIRGTDTVLSNGEATVRCFKGCDNEIGLEILRNVLPENRFEKFLKKRQDIEVMAANINDLANCPFCPFVMELGPQIQIFMCKNPECKKISCRKCKKLNHLPIKCEDVLDEHKGRLFIEEEMTKGLIHYCYNCRRPSVKDKGCNLMTCSSCKAKWCHICKQPIQDHSHFNTSMGCVNINSSLFDAQKVEIKKLEALQKVHKVNPDFQLPNL